MFRRAGEVPFPAYHRSYQPGTPDSNSPHRLARIPLSRVLSGGFEEVLEKLGAGAERCRPASSGMEQEKWAVPGLNRGPSDFQSLALPTELTALG